MALAAVQAALLLVVVVVVALVALGLRTGALGW
jgi:hypothetical protein